LFGVATTPTSTIFGLATAVKNLASSVAGPVTSEQLCETQGVESNDMRKGTGDRARPHAQTARPVPGAKSGKPPARARSTRHHSLCLEFSGARFDRPGTRHTAARRARAPPPPSRRTRPPRDAPATRGAGPGDRATGLRDRANPWTDPRRDQRRCRDENDPRAQQYTQHQMCDKTMRGEGAKRNVH
jgi:hypothetical protein